MSHTILGLIDHSLWMLDPKEQAFLTSLAGLILVLLWMIPYIYELFDTIKNLFTL